jgi:hypothetical protein
VGYVISIGAGLALGLGLLIWGLRERSKRHAAERRADKAGKEVWAADARALANAKAAGQSEELHQRSAEQVEVLRARLREARERLVQCQDPKAIKDWLDSELEGGTL